MDRTSRALRDLARLSAQVQSGSLSGSTGDSYLQQFQRFVEGRVPDEYDLPRQVYRCLYDELMGLGWLSLSSWRKGSPLPVTVRSMDVGALGGVIFSLEESYDLDLYPLIEKCVFSKLPKASAAQIEAELRRPPDIFGILTLAAAGFAEAYWQHGKNGVKHLEQLLDSQPGRAAWEKATGGDAGKPVVARYEVSVGENPRYRGNMTGGITARWTGSLEEQDSSRINLDDEEDRHRPLFPRKPTR